MSYREYLAFLVTVVWFISVVRLKKLNEWHHWLFGAWVYIGAAWMGVNWLAWLGLLVMLDDCYAHARENFQPDYKGPLWRLYAWAYPHLPRLFRL